MLVQGNRKAGQQWACPVHRLSGVRLSTRICWCKRGDLCFRFFPVSSELVFRVHALRSSSPHLIGVGLWVWLWFSYSPWWRHPTPFLLNRGLSWSMQAGDKDSFLPKTWGWTDTLLAWSHFQDRISDPLLFPLAVLCSFLPSEMEASCGQLLCPVLCMALTPSDGLGWAPKAAALGIWVEEAKNHIQGHFSVSTHKMPPESVFPLPSGRSRNW